MAYVPDNELFKLLCYETAIKELRDEYKQIVADGGADAKTLDGVIHYFIYNTIGHDEEAGKDGSE